MPGYKGHLAGGIVAFALVLYLLQSKCSSSATAFQWLGCAMAGSLFPDIDVKSKGQKYFYWIVLSFLLVLMVLQKYKLLAVCGVVSITPMLCKHRGLFHEVWFVIAVPCALWAAVSMVSPRHTESFFFLALFFIVGALSHLYLDRGLRGILPKKKFKN